MAENLKQKLECCELRNARKLNSQQEYWLTLQLQQHEDRSFQSHQGCLCQTLGKYAINIKLGCQPGDSSGDDSVSTNIPEDSSFLQQSEKPLRAVRCRGNIPWMPLLKTTKAEEGKSSQHIEGESIFDDGKKNKNKSRARENWLT